MTTIKVFLPIQTKSEANSREHWTEQNKRHKAQRQAVAFTLRPQLLAIALPVKVRLCRVAPRSLDAKDNLPCSMKYILDAIAGLLFKDLSKGHYHDDDERIKVEYSQRKPNDKKSIGVEITIEEI